MLSDIFKKLVPRAFIRGARKLRIYALQIKERNFSTADFWSEHHVDAPPDGFNSVEESLSHLNWRNRQYPSHADYMPVENVNDQVVVDFGCGPGNDIVGFGTKSVPKKLIGFDISPVALMLSEKRAKLHGIDVELNLLDENFAEIPLEDKSVDLIHCAGVLHHSPDMEPILNEFLRILRPTGSARIMVYNRDSIWMHVHVAYETKILHGLYSNLSKEDAFARTTDGPSCPIANCYSPRDFLNIASNIGFDAQFLGSAISLFELKKTPMILDALRDKRLDAESSAFLSSIQFNERLWPLYEGNVAGINGYYALRR